MTLIEKYLQPARTSADLSLLFAAGERPSAREFEQLLAADGLSSHGAQISHRPDAAEGWLELLINGLTFDLAGLSPSVSAEVPVMERQFGVTFDPAHFQFEAITIAPGQHIEAGRAMLPLMRSLLGIAAGMALQLPVKAVCWHPAGSWMEPNYFTRIVVSWLAGGVFPALGLTAVEATGKGVESAGLDFFAGQEVRVEASPGQPHAETVKLAVRVIDHIIRNGPVLTLSELQGPAGEALLAEPSYDGRQVRVWRSVA